MNKAIRIQDKQFHKRLMRMKLKHGFTSIEAMLKGWEKVYKVYLKEVTK
jgi:hypothetical protein